MLRTQNSHAPYALHQREPVFPRTIREPCRSFRYSRFRFNAASMPILAKSPGQLHHGQRLTYSTTSRTAHFWPFHVFCHRLRRVADGLQNRFRLQLPPLSRSAAHVPDAFTIARMPALRGSGSFGHALTTSASSGIFGVRNAKQDAKTFSEFTEGLDFTCDSETGLRFAKPSSAVRIRPPPPVLLFQRMPPRPCPPAVRRSDLSAFMPWRPIKRSRPTSAGGPGSPRTPAGPST